MITRSANPRAQDGVLVPLAPRYLTLVALLFGAWAVFSHLGEFPLLAPDEGRNAEVAREMKTAGAWLVPTYDGATYLDKPAFFFKAVALSLAALGDTEFAARLPSALSALGLLLLIFLFCRRVYDEATAALAVVVVASTPLFMAFSRIVIFDMMLAFFVCAAILAAYRAEEPGEEPNRRRYYLLATLAAGLATLVKGPVGFLVPLLVMTAFHLIDGHRGAIKRFFALPNVALFLAVVLPWFVGLSLACPDFPYYGIMKESIARFTTPEFRRTQPFYYYALIIAGGYFAWSVILPESLRVAWRDRARLSRADRLFAIWALGVVIFFSLSQSKLPGYILTGVVALGVLTARVFAEALSGRHPAALDLIRRACLGLALAAGLLALPLLILILSPDALAKPKWLTPDALARFAPLLPTLALSLGGIVLLALWAWIRRNARWALAAFLALPVLLLTVNFDLVPTQTAAKSARAIRDRLPANLPADTEFACDRCMPHGLPFYLGRPVTVFTEDGRELTSNYVLFSLRSGKPWPERLIPAATAPDYLARRRHPVYLMMRGQRRPELAALAGPHGGRIDDFPNDYVGTLLPAPEH